MNIGDVITTATEDELDALPVGTVLHAQSPNVPARCDVWVRWPYGWKTDGLREPEDRPTGYLPMTVLAIPGRLPRPERVVKAEALREAAAHIKNLYATPLPPAIVHSILHGLAAYAEAREA